MFRLNLLGSAALVDDSGHVRNKDLGGTKHLALLIYLLLDGANRPVRRDKVVGVLWPESGQEKARQSLSQALYKLRNTLGDVVISDGQEELSVDRRLITSDCFDFQELAKNGRLEDAVALYRGDVATGFNVKDAAEFDQWLSNRRTSWREQYVAVLKQLFGAAIQADDLTRATTWAEKLILASSDDEAPLRTLLPLLRERGQSASAKRVYEKYAHTLAIEYETVPSPDIAALVEGLQHGHPSPHKWRPFIQQDGDPLTRRRGFLRTAAVAAAVLAVVIVSAWQFRPGTSKAKAADYATSSPRVAVLPFASAGPAQRSATVLNEALQWRLRSVGFEVLNAGTSDTSAIRHLVSAAGENGLTFLVGGDVVTERDGSVAARLWLKDAGNNKRVWESRFTQEASEAHLIATQLSDAVTTQIRRAAGSVLELATGAGDVSVESWRDVYRARERMEAATDMRWQEAAAGAAAELKDAELTLTGVTKREHDWALPWVLRGRIAEARAFSTYKPTDPAPSLAELDRGIRMLDSVATRLESEDVYEMRGLLRSRRVALGVDDVAVAKRMLSQAEADLRKSFGPGRDLSRGYAALSDVMFMQGQYAEAFVYARRAYDTNVFLRNNEQVLVGLFNSALHAGDDQAADYWCKELQNALPRQWPAVLCRIHLAGFAPQMVDAATLEREIANVIAPPPIREGTTSRLNAAYAITLAQLGQTDRARSMLGSVADNKDPEVVLFRAFAFAALNDAPQAHAELRQYLAEARGTRSTALHMRWLNQGQIQSPLTR